MDPTAFSAVFTGAFNEVRQSDRNFVRGYFLPAGIFSALCVQVFSLFDLLSAAVNLWLGVGVAVSLTALLAVILFVLNPSLVRAKEGYGLFNQPWNPFKLWEERRFRKIEVELQELLERRSSENEVPPEVLNRLTALAHRRAVRFPDDKRYLLPTAFGNTVRAFEIYPRVMYGVESTECWERLLTIVPKEYREFMSLTKAKMDFWLNLWYLLLLILGVYVGLAIAEQQWYLDWLLLLVASGIPLASRQSRGLAEQWGKTVKACFDVYLPELRSKLGLPLPASREAEREQWISLSQALTFRLPKKLPELAKPDEGLTGPAERI